MRGGLVDAIKDITDQLAQEQPRMVGGLIAPAEVVIYIQSDLKRTDFVQPLVCALQRVLTAPSLCKL